MNIKEAKQQIADTLAAYLLKDELGNYRIPPVRQRPILLMGPPGIGKTQIMEQIAAESGVSLVAYTITHHTRQSAIGLPVMEKRCYDGREYTVTEYTMSEILGSVYESMKQTGIREGILFLDEINCVSETLAPMMLQFLQCKTFGNQRLPDGWLIVAAGNPPEYNRSVRDFDVVTLDRVRLMNVEADFGVWREYALRKGLHGAVISYLDIKKDAFYRMENTADGLRFVTARGWEDLSELLYAYEALGLTADRIVTAQYLRDPAVAGDFADYLALYYKYQKTWHIEEIVRGREQPILRTEFRSAPFDEKLSVLGLLYSRLADLSWQTRLQDLLTQRLHLTLKEFRDSPTQPIVSSLDRILADRQSRMQKQERAGQLDKESRALAQTEIHRLEEFRSALVEADTPDTDAAMTCVRSLFADDIAKRSSLADETGLAFDNAFRFLEESVGQSQELVLFVTELTAGFDTSWYIENFGCDAYFRHNKELLFNETRRRITEDIRSAMNR